jgi:hypothetical protein
MTTENQLLRPACFDFFLSGSPAGSELRAYVEQLEARAALTQPAQPAEGGEAAHIEVVGEVVEREDGNDVLWSIEGGIDAIPAGMVLLISNQPITDDQGHGEVYTAPPASQEQATRYLIRARWPDGIEQYLDINNVTDLGGKVGIDVDVPMVHPLTASQEQAQQPSGGEAQRIHTAWEVARHRCKEAINEHRGFEIDAMVDATLCSRINDAFHELHLTLATPKPEQPHA